MTTNIASSDVRRQAGWLPRTQDQLEAWLEGHRDRVRSRGDDLELHPVLVELRELLNSTPILRMHVNEMIAQVPKTRKYSQRHVESVDELLQLVNEVLGMAPEFGDQTVTLPLTAILDWTMATSAGFAAYRDDRLNQMIRRILTVWSEFLSSPQSLYVLNDSPRGWKCEAARRAIGIEQYHHDPNDEHWGFRSWNDFFTRRFKQDARPVDAPDDDSVIVSACESTPYAIARHVQLRDAFWIKSQPYSLSDMLAGSEEAERFVDGTVYQAFLSATNYHRWHSPVSGTIIKAFVAPGTYYSEADSEGADAEDPVVSQGYLAHVATRAIILIEADNPLIGLVAFVAIGMLEVSSCLLGSDISVGHHVTKGDELGYFQFGGSTHCLVFGSGVVENFDLRAVPQPGNTASRLVLVRSKIATARQSRDKQLGS